MLNYYTPLNVINSLHFERERGDWYAMYFSSAYSRTKTTFIRSNTFYCNCIVRTVTLVQRETKDFVRTRSRTLSFERAPTCSEPKKWIADDRTRFDPRKTFGKWKKSSVKSAPPGSCFARFTITIVIFAIFEKSYYNVNEREWTFRQVGQKRDV